MTLILYIYTIHVQGGGHVHRGLCSQSLPRKGYQFTSQALRVLTRVLISLPLVKVFSFLFLIFWFHCIVTFDCMLSCICMLTWENIY